MCGRFAIRDPDAIYRRVIANARGLIVPPELRHPRYNVAPGQIVAAVRRADPCGAERILSAAKWGLIPSWARDPAIGSRLINARAETLSEKPAFRKSASDRRCLVPADGFYEWQRGGRQSQPYFVHRRDGASFTFAGLWDRWRAPDGSEILSLSIVTTTANGEMQPIHDRMPVILAEDAEQAWLGEGDLPQDLLQPYPDGLLQAVPVSTRVNKVSDDDAGLVEAVPLVTEAPPRQGSLF